MANKRQRRLWGSVALTALGVVVLVGLGLLREFRDDTDLMDPTSGVTTEFKHGDVEGAPEFIFRDVATELGIDFRHGPGPRGRTLPEDTGSGLAWGDYDGDGDDDLYLVNFAGPLGQEPVKRVEKAAEASEFSGGNRLFRNDGGRFVDVTSLAGVEDLAGFGMGASFADFDNDNDLDLFVTNYGPNRLFRNRGDGTFEDVAPQLGLDGDTWSIAALWGDFDHDELLDLYVTTYVDYDPRAPEMGETNPLFNAVPFTLNPNAFDPMANFLYQQSPDGTFEEVALLMGVSNQGGRSLAASFADLDSDGWLDLYVANDVSPNALFHNRGGKDGFATFEDWSAITGTADERGSMGISIADLASTDGPPDGKPDLFISHWVAQENAMYVATEMTPGRLEYRDRIRQYRLGEVSTDRVGWGSALVDLDLDGRLDLVVANGSTIEDETQTKLQAQRAFVFWNGGERFYDVTGASGEDVAVKRVARGLAVSDFDLDGDVDLALSINRGEAVLLNNEGPPKGGWLAVQLAAVTANSIGARIELRALGHRDTRFRGADVSFASGHSQTEVFGLGTATEADVTVLWPQGHHRIIRNVVANRRILVFD